MLGKTNAVVNVASQDTSKEILEGNVENLVSDATQLNGYNFFNNPSLVSPVQPPKLKTISLPNCIRIGYGAFYGCYNLISVNLPLVEILAASVFNSCTKLETISLPSLLTLGNVSIFYNCRNLTEANFPLVTGITEEVFRYCYKLNKITLGANQVCNLINTNAFSNAGTQNTNPNHIIYIYVPSALIENYKVATNWSTLYNNGKVDFLPITE